MGLSFLINNERNNSKGFEKGTMPLYRWKPEKTLKPVFEVLQTIFPLEAHVPIERVCESFQYFCLFVFMIHSSLAKRWQERIEMCNDRRTARTRFVYIFVLFCCFCFKISTIRYVEFFSQVPLSREELEGLVKAKDWKPTAAEKSLLKKAILCFCFWIIIIVVCVCV